MKSSELHRLIKRVDGFTSGRQVAITYMKKMAGLIRSHFMVRMKWVRVSKKKIMKEMELK